MPAPATPWDEIKIIVICRTFKTQGTNNVAEIVQRKLKEPSAEGEAAGYIVLWTSSSMDYSAFNNNISPSSGTD